MSSSTARPLPLKQRTSSVDTRRDYSTQTWTSVLGLLKIREYVITVDHFSIWRRHLAWAINDGKALRDHTCQRYASSMVFMSLLLSTELGVLFNSAGVTTEMRQALMQANHTTMHFWTGIFIIISAILTLLGLMSTFTAWSMVSAVSPSNAHCIFRSSIGQYVAELPGRFVVSSIYSFLVWLSLFFFLLLPLGFYSIVLLLIVLGLFLHTVTAFSAFGRIIMHTGAMGSQRIFDPNYEVNLLPHSLHANLLEKAKVNLANSTSIMRQYRTPSKPYSGFSNSDIMSSIDSNGSMDSSRTRIFELFGTSQTHPLLSNNSNNNSATPDDLQVPRPVRSRRRTESLVKFDDGLDTLGDSWIRSPSIPVELPVSTSNTLTRTPIRTPLLDATESISAERPTQSSSGVVRPPKPSHGRNARPEDNHNRYKSQTPSSLNWANESTRNNQRDGQESILASRSPAISSHSEALTANCAPLPARVKGQDQKENEDQIPALLYERLVAANFMTSSPGVSSRKKSSDRFRTTSDPDVNAEEVVHSSERKASFTECLQFASSQSLLLSENGSTPSFESLINTNDHLTEVQKFDLEFGTFPDHRRVDQVLDNEYIGHDEEEEEDGDDERDISGIEVIWETPTQAAAPSPERRALLDNRKRDNRFYEATASRSLLNRHQDPP